ncbi:hypothetical protein [Emticicia agri]|uniref:Uncharacterized protein n=1 Tax=Emticicia agri TaxID=2492393 RepID=A0A4Q5LSX7_9BACT|nr:hypothetical protein [Emticicia agri]RYU92597.1 hypothetical protein EWM59_26340 [Emticicia agri]
MLAKGATGHEYVFDYQEIIIIILIIMGVACLSMISYADDKYSNFILKWISSFALTGILFIQVYALIQSFDIGSIVGSIILSIFQLVVICLNVLIIRALYLNKFSGSS